MEPGLPEPSCPGGFRLWGMRSVAFSSHVSMGRAGSNLRPRDLGSPSGAVSLSAAERACNSVSGE